MIFLFRAEGRLSDGPLLLHPLPKLLGRGAEQLGLGLQHLIGDVQLAPHVVVDDRGLLARRFGHRFLDGRHECGGQCLRLLGEGLVRQLDVLDGATRSGHDGDAAIGVRCGGLELRYLALHPLDVRELVIDFLDLRLEPLELREEPLELR